MANAPLSEELKAAAYAAVQEHGNIVAAARVIGISPSTLTNRYQAALSTGRPDIRRGKRELAVETDGEATCPLTVDWPVTDGVFLAFADAHWTRIEQPRSLAHEALLRAAPHIKPDHLLSVGDLMDFSSIGRHPPVMWQGRPRVKDELEAAEQHLSDLAAAAPGAKKWWVRGNHDDRHDKFLAANAALYEGEPGMCLAEKFPDWRMGWRLNFGAFQAMHRWHGGVHAAWNNVLKAGVSIVSADGHVDQVRGHSNFAGRCYGIQLGMLGDPRWPCFSYMLGNPRAWSSGWAVLTVRSGRLLHPEVCEVVEGGAWFRGELLAGRGRRQVKRA